MLARKAHLVRERPGPLGYAECISRAAAANSIEERDAFLGNGKDVAANRCARRNNIERDSQQHAGKTRD